MATDEDLAAIAAAPSAKELILVLAGIDAGVYPARHKLMVQLTRQHPLIVYTLRDRLFGLPGEDRPEFGFTREDLRRELSHEVENRLDIKMYPRDYGEPGALPVPSLAVRAPDFVPDPHADTITGYRYLFTSKVKDSGTALQVLKKCTVTKEARKITEDKVGLGPLPFEFLYGSLWMLMETGLRIIKVQHHRMSKLSMVFQVEVVSGCAPFLQKLLLRLVAHNKAILDFPDTTVHIACTGTADRPPRSVPWTPSSTDYSGIPDDALVMSEQFRSPFIGHKGMNVSELVETKLNGKKIHALRLPGRAQIPVVLTTRSPLTPKEIASLEEYINEVAEDMYGSAEEEAWKSAHGY